MTTPAEPATGAGEPATGPASPEQQAPTGQPSATDPATDWATAFEGMTPEEVKTALGHSRTWEKRAKDNKKALDDLRSKATAAEGEPTAEDLRKQLEDATTARQQAEDRAAEMAYRETVRDVAGTNLDAAALLDSDSFRRKVQQELGDDHDDTDLLAAVRKVAKSKEYAGNPRFAKTVGASRSGGEFHGGPGTTPLGINDQIAAAEKDGDWKAARRLKSQQMLQTNQ